MIVKRGDVIKLLVKGADSSMLPLLTDDFHHPYLLETQAYLTKFSLLGYRTLVFGERYLTKSQFDEIMKEYKAAIVSEKRSQLINEMSLKVERDLTLLGATAVEDSLQVNVKECITRLL